MTTLSDPMNYIAYQASPSMGFCRQEYWRGLPFFLQGSSRPRDQTCVSFIGRWILDHCAPGKQALVRGPKVGLENVPPRSRLFWEPLQSPLFSGTHGCIFKDAFFSHLPCSDSMWVWGNTPYLQSEEFAQSAFCSQNVW